MRLAIEDATRRVEGVLCKRLYTPVPVCSSFVQPPLLSSMANITTPRSKGVAEPTTPVVARLAAPSASALQSSPHYTTTRRHSLYGSEDRIILDPGSRVWKVGFSGEGRPRDVFFVADGERTSLWGLTRGQGSAEREEEERMLKVRLQDKLRGVFHE